MRSSWTATATPAHRKFLDAAGNPAIKPPWDTLATIDLNTGGFRWQVPLGGANGNGAENHGGSLVTAGGLGFIAATKDTVLRAFGRGTGRVAWEAPLPAAVFATPTSYSIGGEQFVVIACGGENRHAAWRPLRGFCAGPWNQTRAVGAKAPHPQARPGSRIPRVGYGLRHRTRSVASWRESAGARRSLFPPATSQQELSSSC